VSWLLPAALCTKRPFDVFAGELPRGCSELSRGQVLTNSERELRWLLPRLSCAVSRRDEGQSTAQRKRSRAQWRLGFAQPSAGGCSLCSIHCTHADAGSEGEAAEGWSGVSQGLNRRRMDREDTEALAAAMRAADADVHALLSAELSAMDSAAFGGGNSGR
jgi:hypothetical protein